MSDSYHDDNREGISSDRPNAIWIRGLMMLLLMFCFGIAQSLLYVMAVVQFLWMLIKGERNVFLADFGWSLSQWLAETARFLTGGTEEKPFPWKPWPTA